MHTDSWKRDEQYLALGVVGLVGIGASARLGKEQDNHSYSYVRMFVASLFWNFIIVVVLTQRTYVRSVCMFEHLFVAC